MKRIFTLGAIIAILAGGCEVHPYADFAVNNRVVQPNDIVYFTNLSDNSVSYDWDFGDGTYSKSFSPSHVYTREGTYTVTLTAVSKDGNIDRASNSIEVYFTELEIEVAEWNPSETIVYIVPDARVRLYTSLSDWDNERNPYTEAYTNASGIVVFIGLPAQRYYVDVIAADYSNYALGLDDVGYIETPILQPGRITSFLAWADYYPPEILQTNRKNIDVSKINSKRATLIQSDVSK